jgi:hypothetical protein
MTRPDAGAILVFLRRFFGDAPWPLLAIKRDSGDIKAATFGAAPRRETAAAAWAARWNGAEGYDLYFAINPLKMALNKKAGKDDVRCAAYLWADLDPRKEADQAAEQAALARALDGARPPAIPVPTWEIDSGRGRWGFWRLREPVPVDGKDGEATRRVEGYGRGIERAFEGLALVADSCRNVDRIARLPGSANSKTGRLAAVVAFRPEAVYELENFPFAEVPPAAKDPPTGKDKFDSLPPADVDALPVSPRIRLMIRTGLDEKEPAVPFADCRSERALTVLIALAGAGCDDATMAAVMLDAALPIGAHVREQPKPERYLARQIMRARDRAADPEIAKLNEIYALVIVGDRAVVLEEYTDAEGRDAFRLLPKSAFETWFENRIIKVGDKHVPLAKHWLRNQRRRQYSNIVFAPGRDVPGAYNLWRGFAVEPRPGDCSKFLAHLRDNVCCGNEELFRWVVGWFADIVQNPAKKCGTSLALRGKQGVGKTKVGEVMGSILGKHYTIVADPRYITGRFNSHLVDCLLLHADEGFWAGDHAAEGKLKDLITGHEHLIEFKGKEPFRVLNFLRMFVTGNPDWIVPAGMRERRFAVLDVGEDHIQEGLYFAAIDAEMDAGGREALLFHLLNFDLETVDLRTIPRTAALIEQQVSSATPEQQWWLDTLQRGELPWGCYGDGECPAGRLVDRYVEHAKQRGVPRRSCETKLGMFLRKAVPNLRRNPDGLCRSPVSPKEDVGTVYTFPDLGECRAAFAQQTQFCASWEGCPREWRVEPRREPAEPPARSESPAPRYNEYNQPARSDDDIPF